MDERINKNTISHSYPLHMRGVEERTLYDLRLEDIVDSGVEKFAKAYGLGLGLEGENLKKIVFEGLKFNIGLNWFPLDSLDVVRTPEDMLGAMKNRADVFRESFVGYDKTFNEKIPGLLYDEYDSCSPLFVSKKDVGGIKTVIGTIRFCKHSAFDPINLKSLDIPSASKFESEDFKLTSRVSECSRQTILKEYQGGSSSPFRSFYSNAYVLAEQLGLTHYVARIDEDHLRLYEKFGGLEVQTEIPPGDDADKPSYMVSWDVSKVTPFFQKAFLNKSSVRRIAA